MKQESLAELLAKRFEAIRAEFEKALADTCPIPLFVCDSAGQWIHANKAVAKLLCTTEQNLLGDGWKDYIFSSCASGCPVDLRFAEWLKIRYIASNGRVGYASVQATKTPTVNYVCFIMPVCADPVCCPIQEYVLTNTQLTPA